MALPMVLVTTGSLMTMAMLLISVISAAIPFQLRHRDSGMLSLLTILVVPVPALRFSSRGNAVVSVLSIRSGLPMPPEGLLINQLGLTGLLSLNRVILLVYLLKTRQ